MCVANQKEPTRPYALLIKNSLHRRTHHHHLARQEHQYRPKCLSHHQILCTARCRRQYASGIRSGMLEAHCWRARDGTDTRFKDPETVPGAPPSFILRLSNEDELTFNFTCTIRQQTTGPTTSLGEQVLATNPTAALDTHLTGLTYIFASNAAEIEQLTTREFHADPNLHRNPNVELVGHYGTDGTPSVQFNWTWTWKPPKQTEDRGGGWRNTCSVRAKK